MLCVDSLDVGRQRINMNARSYVRTRTHTHTHARTYMHARMHTHARMHVQIATSVAGAVMSWQEFDDTVQKIERYNMTVRKMKNLQTWWKSLGEVEKTSVANVETLLETAESAILNEVSAWRAVGTTKTLDGNKKDVQDSHNNDEAGSFREANAWTKS